MFTQRKARGFRRVVSVTAVVLMQPCQEDAVCFLCESKITLIGLPKVDAVRNHWIRLVYNTTAQPKCSNLCNTFLDDSFAYLVEYKAG